MDYIGILLIIMLLVTAVFSTVCAWNTRKDRTYYPMLKVIWSVFGFVYFGGAINNIFTLFGVTSQTPQTTRFIFNLLAMGTVIYCFIFLRSRNRQPIDVIFDHNIVNMADLRETIDQLIFLRNTDVIPETWREELCKAMLERAKTK